MDFITENKAPKVTGKDIVKGNVHPKPIKSVPSVTLYGCGGCGTNLTFKFVNQFGKKGINYKIIDTSISNVKSSDMVEFVTGLGNLGSGKFRAENYNVINAFISRYIKDTKNKLSDINIVMFSLSGGSGSVIGPILIKNLIQAGKSIVVVAIGNDISQIDTLNTLNTIKTLVNISESQAIPILPLSNSVGREKTDAYVMEFLDIFTEIILSNAKEVDYTDKINFLNPHKVLPLEIKNGLHVILGIKNGDKEDNILSYLNDVGVIVTCIDLIDSMFVIYKDHEVKSSISTKIIYQGFDPDMEENTLVVSILSNGIPQEYIDHLKSRLIRFKEIDVSNEIVLDDLGNTMDDGIVI